MTNKPRGSVKLSFERKTVRIAIGAIAPLHQITPAVKKGIKYRQISSSIRELGTIEPPVVLRTSEKDKFIMLDGHLRLEVCKDLGHTHVVCLIATDDEAFTYNRHISRLASVQEHKMIMRAIERGVPEKTIAKALDIRMPTLRAKTQMLHGICNEAVDLLKDKQVPIHTFGVLKKMTPLRQIQAAELMISMNIFTEGYAASLLASTPKEQLIDPEKPKKVKGLTERQMDMMARESASLDREFKTIEQSYGGDHVDLVLTIGYLRKLIDNTRVARFLERNYEDFYVEFRRMVDTGQSPS
jgi:hypothetical protein